MAIAGVAPDSSWLVATGEFDGAVRVWRVADEHEVVLVPPASDDEADDEDEDVTASMVRIHAIGPDGTWLATGGHADNGVRIWDVTTGRRIHELAEAGAVTAAVVAPDGTWLATVDGTDGTIRIWDIATGRCQRQIHHEPSGSIVTVTVTPHDGHPVTIDNHAVRVWDTATGEATAHELTAREQTGPVQRCQWLTDGRLAVIGTTGIHMFEWHAIRRDSDPPLLG